MAHDEDLAARLRALLSGERGVTEKRMFGGIAFLVNGNMAIAASAKGGLLVRADPADGDRLVASGKARPMTMRGRAMTGWLRVDAASVRTKAQLTTWAKGATAYARSLPAKR
ncbi:MAG: TfoX/Sxy family protein [Chloroflexota bacterium]|nr:TfoX/Sxy family protein [Chloroflexota bacterium]MDE3193439.1 TfoX/Sxy family protein [Chloroflexota bacterium]